MSFSPWESPIGKFRGKSSGFPAFLFGDPEQENLDEKAPAFYPNFLPRKFRTENLEEKSFNFPPKIFFLEIL